MKTDSASIEILKLDGAKVRKTEIVNALPANYTGSDVILYNGGDTNLLQPFVPSGTKVTIINIGANTITFFSLFSPIKPSGISGNIALENSDSITLIGTANGTAVKEIVR